VNGYARIVAQLPETVRRAVPAGSIVLVVSKGDDRLVRIDGRRGWHFPRAEDGSYAGFHPESGADAVAMLEELRAAGAAFLAFPATSLWWLEHYPELAEHLEERFDVAARDDTCVVFDVRHERAPRANGRPAAGGAVEHVRSLLAAHVPAEAAVVVVGAPGAEPVDLGGRRALALPQNGEDPVTALERMRAAGGEYLVVAGEAGSRLGQLGRLPAHVEANHRKLAGDRDCVVYELSDRAAVELAASLLPAGAPIAVASAARADTRGFSEFDVRPLILDDDEGAAVAAIEGAARDGVRFLVLPNSRSSWLEAHGRVAQHLRDRHRLITRQRHACEIYELCVAAPSPAENAPPRGLLARVFGPRA
jgi:hypothetical protein